MRHTPGRPAVAPTALRRPLLAHLIATIGGSAFAAGAVHAQDTGATSAAPALPPVTITAPAPARVPGIVGFAGQPLEALPMQATIVEREQLDEIGADRLSDLTALDASTSDSYNSYGYWDFLAIRGYTLGQRYNYRREGLPISAETPIPLGNKERIEILKGTSGIQAGTSAPGGMVNYRVKRPTAQPLRRATLRAGDAGSVGAALDVGGRVGPEARFGYRLNLAHDDDQPRIEDYGHLRRSLVAGAGDWRLAPETLVEAEVEWSHHRGPSLPGYSLLGEALPAPRKPGNLNNQPWSLPNDFEALTGTLRLDQGLGGGWRWVTTLGRQRLKTDDRLAYPFGFNCGATTGEAWCDRYGSTGQYDLYDFRSDRERRLVTALETAFTGQLRTGALTHELRAGIAVSRVRNRFQASANNFVGQGNVDGTAATPADPSLTDPNTNRDERSTELFVNDAIDWGHGVTTWLGLRHTRLQREAVRTDGSRPTSYSQSLTTPWLAASWRWAPGRLAYASWGQGAESYVVPNRPGDDQYVNAGQPLPVQKSRQWELGLRGGGDAWQWGLAWFDIDRPAVSDARPVYAVDGSDRHRGLEGTIDGEAGAWSWHGGAMWLDAERRGAADASANGRRPVNVPRHTLKLRGAYRVAALPGLAVQAGVAHEGRRNVTDDGSIKLPSWTRVDAGARYAHDWQGTTLTWRAGIDNLFDRRAWKESPKQFGHYYLYPLEARTWRLSLQADF